jgi:hypothetical protein
MLLLLLAGLAVWSGEWHKVPIYTGYIVCFFGAFVWPLLVMGRLRRQQDQLLDKIRAQYVIATTLLMTGETAQARERLAVIRGLEAYWRLGAHPVIRYAHIAYAAVTNFGIAFTGQLFHYHIQSTRKPDTLGDTLQFMFDTPSVLWTTVGVALFFSLMALSGPSTTTFRRSPKASPPGSCSAFTPASQKPSSAPPGCALHVNSIPMAGRRLGRPCAR